MLLESPGPIVEEFEDANPQRRLSLTASLPPARLEFVSTREECGPSLANKVCDKHDECSLDGDGRWLEHTSVQSAGCVFNHGSTSNPRIG